MVRLIHLGQRSDHPPLFAVPGLDGTIGSVEPVVSRLAQRREVIVVDYSVETNPTLEALSGEIAAVVRAEGHPIIDLLGQSIGTILAAQLASAYGLPVRKVALCCTFTHPRWTMLRLTVLVLRLAPRWLYRLTSDPAMILICGPVGDGREHPAFAAARDGSQAGAARRTDWEINRDFSADLVQIQQPLLILMGEQDRFVPNAQQEVEKLRALFSNRDAQVDTIPNAGHIFLPSDAIALASDKIVHFLE